MNLYTDTFRSPFGELTAAVDDAGALVALTFVPEKKRADPLRRLEEEGARVVRDPQRAAPAVDQLCEYFAGRRRAFDLELSPRGTDFQRQVWRALLAVPFGETRSYAQLAEGIGRPGAARAVGRAVGSNPISIVIPCHRIVGADGSLTGYAGGLGFKTGLLELEGRPSP